MLSAILLVTACGLVQELSAEYPVVSTNVGPIQGNVTEDGYTEFLGIPYAVVNTSNTFGPSIKHPGFNDTFVANETTVCVQRADDGVATGTLDCLTLNVYVPSNYTYNATAENLLPVMVYIHGGAFVTGSGGTDYGPKLLLQHDVIVVTINYRLSVYGFMCLDIPEVSGNQGLKDQVLALRWVNENIEAFGGDAEQITLFGQSAGGMSTNLHVLSSYEVLFKQAIIESGPAVSPWVIVDVNNTVPLQLAAAFDYNTTDLLDAVNYLMTIDPLILVAKAYDMNITAATGTHNPLLSPCIEKNIEGVEHFITEHPMNIISPKVSTTPMIIGNTNNELAFQYGNADAEFFNTYDFRFMNMSFVFENFDDALVDIKHVYLRDEKPCEDLNIQITNYGTDFIFTHPTQRMTQIFLETGAEKVYRYLFSYSGGRNYLKECLGLNVTGAIHADELGYLFDFEMYSGITPDSADQLMIDRMTTLWTNFAKYGDPTPETSDLLPVKWEPVTNTTQPYLSIDANLTLANRPVHERMAFWDVFYKLHYNEQKWNNETKYEN